ncbi:hypothetical protein KI688_004255 [Linnemannia hyalina]|uniref:Secreted protein n=1 Tax=Linnemannia hyalina TaxID=64524 RepID=A0A9P7XNI8_9FUNG|nr:hypothetical protein KI688_004255 [Linnemannia hyalina]
MKTTTILLLALALALFVQAAPIETRDDKGPTSPPNHGDDVSWTSTPGHATTQDDKGPTSPPNRRGDTN